MKKIIMIFCIVACVFMVWSCGDDGDTINYQTPVDEEVTDKDTSRDFEPEVDTDDLIFPCRDNNLLERIAVTVPLYDEDGMPSYEAKKVGKRIYEHAVSALDQCFDYGDVFEIYQDSMRMLNACHNTVHTPEIIEEYFFESMREIVGYDPRTVCPGGCGSVDA